MCNVAPRKVLVGRAGTAFVVDTPPLPSIDALTGDIAERVGAVVPCLHHGASLCVCAHGLQFVRGLVAQSPNQAVACVVVNSHAVGVIQARGLRRLHVVVVCAVAALGVGCVGDTRAFHHLLLFLRLNFALSEVPLCQRRCRGTPAQ